MPTARPTHAHPAWQGYVFWALSIGFCGAFIGRLLSIYLIKHLSHPSLIVFSLGGLLVASMALLIARSVGTGADWHFAPLCG